ncbi:hypothetical protein Pelo_13932 [Pelomyxa schiedti]|nr:hypothetical protein Pelo_13932 [Pelomyxa schiedti]
MLTHPRCGRGHHNPHGAGPRGLPRRPARPTAASPAQGPALAIRVVWDWVLHDAPVAWLNVRMAKHRTFWAPTPWLVGRPAPGVEALFTVGVSLATLGVVPDTRDCVRAVEWEGSTPRAELIGASRTRFVEWIRGDKMVYLAPRRPLVTPLPGVSVTEPHNDRQRSEWGECELSVGASGDRVPLAPLGDGMTFSMNHKWLVINDRSSHQNRVVIVNLLLAEHQNQQQQQQPPTKVMTICGKSVSQVFLDEYHCDEALFIYGLEGCWDAVVVNLAQLWTPVECNFTPISSTRCLMPKNVSLFQAKFKWLVLWTESRTRAFIASGSVYTTSVLHYAESPPSPEPGDPTVQESLHTAIYSTARMELSQLSDRLYCLSGHKFEIWDCNMPATALRVFEWNGRADMFGHAGFLFRLTGDRVLVSDPDSGTNVAVLTCSKGKVPTDRTVLSFLLRTNEKKMRTRRNRKHKSHAPKQPQICSTTTPHEAASVPLVQVIPSRSVSSQFHTLMLLTHPRCGRGRPGARARGLGRCAARAPPGPPLALAIAPPWLGVAVRAVWDWVLHEAPVALLQVALETDSREWSPRGSEAIVTVGVSLATLGVAGWYTRRCACDGRTQLVAATHEHLVERTRDPSAGTGPCRYWDYKWWDLTLQEKGGCGDRVQLMRYGGGTHLCLNDKWLVINECDRWREERVVIVNLLVAVQQNQWQKQKSNKNLTAHQQQPTKVIPMTGKRLPSGVFMDKYHSDEALFIFRDDAVVDAVVINLEQLWNSADDSFRPIGSTRCLLPTTFASLGGTLEWLVLWTLSQTRALIVQGSSSVIHYAESQANLPAHIQEVLHSSHYDTSRLNLSQLSERLYCIVGPSVLEVWDCNIPSRAIRVVGLDNNWCDLLFGHCGFMFSVSRDRVLITDYESGTNVVVITRGGASKKSFMTNYTQLSFLL